MASSAPSQPTRIKARYDGRAFVPDRKVSTPVGETVTIELPSAALVGEPSPTRAAVASTSADRSTLPLAFVHPPASPERKRAALDALLRTPPPPGGPIPDWAMSRRWIYAEDHEVAAESERRLIHGDDPEDEDD